MSDELGYELPDDSQTSVIGAQVGETKHPDTLAPGVVLWLRFPDESRHACMLSVELAEQLSAELARWATRARDKHFE